MATETEKSEDKATTPATNGSLVAGADGSAALKVGDKPATPQERRSPVEGLIAAFLPNRAVSPMTMRIIAVVEVLIALAIWITSPFKVLPRPDEVLHAL